MTRINIENAKEALRLLEAQPKEKFDMAAYFRSIEVDEDGEPSIAGRLSGALYRWGAHSCNTVCCLAGLIQMHKAVTNMERASLAYEFAMTWLGLSSYEASFLFVPHYYDKNKGPITKDRVAERLRGLITAEERRISAEAKGEA